MSISLKQITENDFMNLNVPTIFNDNKISRCFGIVTNDIQSFKFAWQSTIVSPIVSEIIKEYVIGIGIDLNFAVVNFMSNRIVLNITLTYLFLDIIISNDFLQ